MVLDDGLELGESKGHAEVGYFEEVVDCNIVGAVALSGTMIAMPSQ